MDANLTKQLIASRNVLRDKLSSLKSDIAASQTQLESTFAPITNPLKDIVQHLSQVTIAPKDEEYDSDFEKEAKPIIKRPRTSLFLKRRSFFPKKSSTPVRAKRTQDETPTLPRTPQRSGVDTLELEHIGTIEPEVHRDITPSFVKPLPPSKSSSSSAPHKRSRFEELITSGTPSRLLTTGRPKRSRIMTRSQVPLVAPTRTVGSDEYDAEGYVPLDVSMVHAKSLLEERKAMLQSMVDSPKFQETMSQLHHVPASYVSNLTRDVIGDYDTKYGVRHGPNGLLIGNTEVTFDGKDIVIGGYTFKGYDGVYQLLFKADPRAFTPRDTEIYRDILNRFHIVREQYNPKLPISASKSSKYTKIIEPLITQPRLTTRQIQHYKTGYGLQKNLSNAQIEYEYWDNPNELVDRLRLLKASERAGHTNHTNEIIAIIEELKEANLIK